VRFDMTKAIKEKLDAEKIDIPFPTQTLHVVKDWHLPDRFIKPDQSQTKNKD
jgi:small-conductance mechanosensitive channel